MTITVVIPLYNKAQTIERALRSVQEQILQPDEVIVVNDGSTDGGSDIVSQQNLQYLRLVQQTNQGVASARNHGIAEAQGEWIALLDADDEWKPEFLLSMQQLHHSYPDCNLLASAYDRIDLQGNQRTAHIRGLNSSAPTLRMDHYFDVAAHSEPPICSSAVMMKRETILSVGGFPEHIAQGEDLLTWAKIALITAVAYCPLSLSVFHVDDLVTTGTPKRRPTDADPVGAELEDLARANPEQQGIQDYVALWHKMRANMFLRVPKRRRACYSELRKARLWNPHLSLPTYHLLLMLPYTLRMRLITLLQR